MTIFVGGVHAVGKTSTLGSACSSLNVRHATASQLIKEQRGISNWNVSRRVEDIDTNQLALISAVKRLAQNKEVLILDGHFVLRRDKNLHKKVSLEVFEQLLLTGVILIEAPYSIIAERLLQRGDSSWDTSEIEAFSISEEAQAKAVAHHLNIPLIKLNLPTNVEVRDAILRLINNMGIDNYFDNRRNGD